MSQETRSLKPFARSAPSPRQDISGAPGQNGLPDTFLRFRFEREPDLKHPYSLFPPRGHIQSAVVLRQLGALAARGPVPCALILAVALSLLSGSASRASAGLIRPGREAFDVASLAPWRGHLVSAVALSGNRVTREELVRHQIRTTIGRPLDLRTLDEDILRLSNLGTFSDVRVRAAEDGAGGVDLTFVVKETYSILPVPALLYTEENGFSFGVGVSAPNLGGRALKLSGKAFFGGTRQYWFNFDAPWLYRPGHHSIGASLAHRDRDDSVRSFHENSDEARASFGRYFGDRLRGSLDLWYLDMRSDTPGITLSPDDEDHLLGVGFTLLLDTRDSWAAPRRGWHNDVAVFRFSALDGDASFWQMNLDLRRWIPTTPRQKLLLSSLLTLQTGALGEDVPVYMDYSIGGANTVRGYDVGADIEGKNQLIGTAEYSWTLMPPRRWDIAFLSVRVGVEAAIFADAGIAWTRPQDLGLRRTRAGIGAGLRLLVPGTEMLRFDLGWSGQEGFHFHLGTGSKPAAQRQRLR